MNPKVSKDSVNYRPATLGWFTGHRCGTCSMFREPSSCTLVAGPIRPMDVCNRWAPKDSRETWRL